MNLDILMRFVRGKEIRPDRLLGGSLRFHCPDIP